MQKPSQNHNTQCMVCFSIFEHKQGLNNCPACGAWHELFMSVNHFGYININWQQLRMLAIFAQRWVATFDLRKQGDRNVAQAMKNIIDILEKYRPLDGADIDPGINKVDMQKAIDDRSEHKKIPSPYFFKKKDK